MFYVVLRRTGLDWDRSLALEEQTGWDAHAVFTDGLVDAGFVILGGPLADEERVVPAVEATSEQPSATPWPPTRGAPPTW